MSEKDWQKTMKTPWRKLSTLEKIIWTRSTRESEYWASLIAARWASRTGSKEEEVAP